GAGGFGVVGVAGFVELHLLEDPAAAQVGGGQGVEVFFQVGFHLALGFDHEPEVPAVAAQAGGQADGVGAGVPEGVEEAGAVVELFQAVGAPGEVVGFLLGGLQQVGAGVRVAGDGGLADVEGLGADLANVVDAHEAGGVAAFGGVQFNVGLVAGRVGAFGGGAAADGFHGVLGAGQEVVEGAEAAGGVHGGDDTGCVGFRAPVSFHPLRFAL